MTRVDAAVFPAAAPRGMRDEPSRPTSTCRKARANARGLLPLCVILVGFMALTTLLNVANPIWEAIDEPGHFQYVKFVAEQHRLPGAGDHLPSLAVTGCTSHCVAQGDVERELPLYYILEAPFVLPINLNTNVSWVANPYFTWANFPERYGAAVHIAAEAWPYKGMVLGVHVMRAVSGLMVLGALIALYFTALAVGWGRGFALLATSAAAVTPGLLLTSASVNNDNAAILTCSLALLGGVKALTDRRREWHWFGLCVFATLLGLAAKGTAYFLVPIVVVLAVCLARRRLGKFDARTSVLGLGLLVILTGLIAWTPRYQLLGTLRGLPSAIASIGRDWPCQCNLFAQPLWGAIPNLWETWWGSYGWETFHPPPPFYRPFLAFTLLSLAGISLLAWRVLRLGLRKALRDPSISALFLLAGGFTALLVLVDARVIATHSAGGTTHARFLFPAMVAGATLITCGFFVLPKLLRITGFALYFSSCLALVAYSAYILPHAFGPELPVFGDLEAAHVQHEMTLDYSSGMRLVGWSTVSEPPGAGQTQRTIHLRLFWEAWTTPDFDYSAYLHLAGPGGVALSGPDHGPGMQLGLLPHLWQPGEVIPDDWTIQVPAAAPPGKYTLTVGVYDYRDLKPVPTTAGADSVAVGAVTL